MPRRLRLALDQNFPTPLINAVRRYLPTTMDVASLREIDPRLFDLDDRPLFLALHQLGWGGLITNNYKMLYVPAEIAAIVKTKSVVVAVKGLGHDPPPALTPAPALPMIVRPGSGESPDVGLMILVGEAAAHEIESVSPTRISRVGF